MSHTTTASIGTSTILGAVAGDCKNPGMSTATSARVRSRLLSSSPRATIRPVRARAVYAPRLNPTMTMRSPTSKFREMNV